MVLGGCNWEKIDFIDGVMKWLFGEGCIEFVLVFVYWDGRYGERNCYFFFGVYFGGRC